MLRVGVASSEAFMPYYEFELVTDATCQHQGGMILKIDKERRTKPNVSQQSSRWSTRTDVPQFCNSGSRSQQR